MSLRRRSACLLAICLLTGASCGADAAGQPARVASTELTVPSPSSTEHPTTAPEPDAGESRPTLVVAGDSIIYDVAPALSEALDPKAARVLPVVAPSLAADSSRLTLLRRIDASSPDLVVVMVGVWERAHVSDEGHKLGDAAFGADYSREALEPIRAEVAAKGGRLLILGPPRLREVAAEREIAELEQIWSDFAAAHRDSVDFVDADTWLGSGPTFTEVEGQGPSSTRLRRTDGVHLCEEGARRIALGVIDMLAIELPETIEPHAGWEHGSWTARFPADECPPPG